MKKIDVVIVGGGVMGLFSAYFLQKEGRSVAVVTGGALPSATLASSSNVGPTVGITGFDVPYGAPDFAARLKQEWDLMSSSLQLYKEVSRSIDLGLTASGVLRIYLGQDSLNAHLERLEKTSGILRMNYRSLSGGECRSMEPLISDEVCGGIYYPDDCWVNPLKIFGQLKNHLRESGVQIIEDRVTGFQVDGSRIGSLTTEKDGALEGDQYILAAGAWLKPLGEMIGLNIPIVPRRGYALLSSPLNFRMKQPILSSGDRITQGGLGISQSDENRFKVSGMIEDTSLESAPDPKIFEALVREASRYVPMVKELDWLDRRIGTRPISSDRQPIIGRLKRYRNIIVLGGHRAGITLGPISAKYAADIIAERDVAIPDRFSPGRFGL